MMRDGVIRFRLAFVVSLLVVLVGLWIVWGYGSSEMGPIGWMFIGVGVLGFVSNLVLRDRLR
ncbi:hypothetical protein [Pseudonocardia sp.]|uniref:hypothetical protein n=1 Tax=Pseudonocardia sp. TaxID=60912 RepID=UPI003D0FE577